MLRGSSCGKKHSWKGRTTLDGWKLFACCLGDSCSMNNLQKAWLLDLSFKWEFNVFKCHPNSISALKHPV